MEQGPLISPQWNCPLDASNRAFSLHPAELPSVPRLLALADTTLASQNPLCLSSMACSSGPEQSCSPPELCIASAAAVDSSTVGLFFLKVA